LGVLSEAAAILAVGTKLPNPDSKDVIGASAATFKAASAAGCTSIHEIALGILAGGAELTIIGEGIVKVTSVWRSMARYDKIGPRL
jgi:hypothetical protein